jgi:flagellar biosynthesis chaperone FliJ
MRFRGFSNGNQESRDSIAHQIVQIEETREKYASDLPEQAALG